ncbi:hypothetical protein BHE74_00027443 [Ensete ventricosum]|nr:hypothetical protein BHE74_00027443 [Ensete ventricosum]
MPPITFSFCCSVPVNGNIHERTKRTLTTNLARARGTHPGEANRTENTVPTDERSGPTVASNRRRRRGPCWWKDGVPPKPQRKRKRQLSRPRGFLCLFRRYTVHFI